MADLALLHRRVPAATLEGFPGFFDSCLTSGAEPEGGRLRHVPGVVRALAGAGFGVASLIRPAAAVLRGYGPVGTVRSAANAESGRRLQTKYPRVLATLTRLRAGGGLTGDFQLSRLWEIAALVEWARPESCLELGSGGSSAMFAELLGDSSRFVTVEQSRHWQERLLAAMQPYDGRFTSVLAEARTTLRDGEPAVHYDIDHARYFDMVYVDGPSTPKSASLADDTRRRALAVDPHGGHFANIDVALMWAHGVFPRVVAIDGRRSTVRKLVAAGHRWYDVALKSEYYARATGSAPPYFLYHTVLLRR